MTLSQPVNHANTMQNQTPTSKTTAASQNASTPAPVGQFHGLLVTEDMLTAAAEELWSETYGDLAGLRDGINYDLHLYTEDGSSVVALENTMMEVDRRGEVICAPILRHRAELPSWIDGEVTDEDQECYDDEVKGGLIAEWVEEMRDNLDPLDEGEE